MSTSSRVPLPSPATIRADVQRMVDFGPQLPGYEGHDRFCAWLVDEFVSEPARGLWPRKLG